MLTFIFVILTVVGTCLNASQMEIDAENKKVDCIALHQEYPSRDLSLLCDDVLK